MMNGRFILATADVTGHVIVWSTRGPDAVDGTGGVDAIKMLQLDRAQG